jgi:hypothetical protein
MQHQLLHPSPPDGCFAPQLAAAVVAVAAAALMVVAVAALAGVFAMTLAAATLQL